MNESSHYYRIQEWFIFVFSSTECISITIIAGSTRIIIIGKLKEAAGIMKLPTPVTLPAIYQF